MMTVRSKADKDKNPRNRNAKGMPPKAEKNFVEHKDVKVGKDSYSFIGLMGTAMAAAFISLEILSNNTRE